MLIVYPKSGDCLIIVVGFLGEPVAAHTRENIAKAFNQPGKDAGNNHKDSDLSGGRQAHLLCAVDKYVDK